MKNYDFDFECIEDFVDGVVDIVDANDEAFVTIIAKFEEMRDILISVMSYTNVNFESICLESGDVSGYTDEYLLSLWSNDGVLEIGCEPLKVNGEYIDPCGDITFLVSNCSSKIIPLCESSELYFLDMDEECCCTENCCDDDWCDDDIHGFTVVKEDDDGYHSYTYYTDDTLDKEDIHTLLKKIGF